MQMYSNKLVFTDMHTLKHAQPTKSPLYHLLTHIHNVFLSPAAHQGLGKLPGMKEICSLMAPFSCIWWHKTQLEVLFWSQGKGFSCRKPEHSEWRGVVSRFLTVPRRMIYACARRGAHSCSASLDWEWEYWEYYGLGIRGLLVTVPMYSLIFFQQMLSESEHPVTPVFTLL